MDRDVSVGVIADKDLARAQAAYDAAAHTVAECAGMVLISAPSKAVMVNGEAGFPVDGWTLTHLARVIAAYDDAREALWKERERVDGSLSNA